VKPQQLNCSHGIEAGQMAEVFVRFLCEFCSFSSRAELLGYIFWLNHIHLFELFKIFPI